MIETLEDGIDFVMHCEDYPTDIYHFIGIDNQKRPQLLILDRHVSVSSYWIQSSCYHIFLFVNSIFVKNFDELLEELVVKCIRIKDNFYIILI